MWWRWGTPGWGERVKGYLAVTTSWIEERVLGDFVCFCLFVHMVYSTG